jgi:hypothetical protein
MVHLMMGVARRQAVLGTPPPSTPTSSTQALEDHELLCGFLSTQQVKFPCLLTVSVLLSVRRHTERDA